MNKITHTATSELTQLTFLDETSIRLGSEPTQTMMNMKHVIVLVIAIAAMAEGAEYTVGDDMGWMVPPTPDYYDTWVSKYYFVVNDTLVFNFEQGKHDITVLSKEDFDACNMESPLFQSPEPGDITVLASDTYYFTCSFGQHCANGQKFAIYYASAPMPPGPCPSPSSMETRPFKFVAEKMGN